MFFISFKKIWFDDSLAEIEIVTRTMSFFGRTRIYTTPEEISDFGKSIAGFPKTSNEIVHFSAGVDGTYGKITGIMQVANSTGRARMDFSIVGTVGFAEEEGLMTASIVMEPTEIDTFSRSLLSLAEGNLDYFELENRE